MAITPRSFGLNPILVLIAALAALGIWSLVQLSGTSCGSVQSPAPQMFEACAVSDTHMSRWTPHQWASVVDCYSDQGNAQQAYKAASVAVMFHPTHPALLNLKGFVAARAGDHATAIYDFRTGERVTGSPDGIFENNIAWTTLFQTDGLSPERKERVLLQTRKLYERSLSKAWSCERGHTALYVEFAIADLAAQTSSPTDPRVQDAVRRYMDLYETYAPCLSRGAIGDELAVEEVLSAVAMDREMSKLSGMFRPPIQVQTAGTLLRASQLGVEVDTEWCAKTVPVERAVDTCASLTTR